MTEVAYAGACNHYHQPRCFWDKMKNFYEQGQKHKAEAEGQCVSRREPEEFRNHFPATRRGSEGDELVKCVGIQDGNDLSEDHRSHVSDIRRTQDVGKKTFQDDERRVAEERVPDTDEQKPDVSPINGSRYHFLPKNDRFT